MLPLLYNFGACAYDLVFVQMIHIFMHKGDLKNNMLIKKITFLVVITILSIIHHTIFEIWPQILFGDLKFICI